MPTAGSSGGLRFNFRGAPLETVLNYMSEAAGYIIVLDTPVRGTVDMYSAQTVSKEEAVGLLNIALNKNGYASVVQGRTIVISSKDDAKRKTFRSAPATIRRKIQPTAEMVIQIIRCGTSMRRRRRAISAACCRLLDDHGQRRQQLAGGHRYEHQPEAGRHPRETRSILRATRFRR